MYYRRAVDHEGEVLESYVTKERQKEAEVHEESHAALWITK